MPRRKGKAISFDAMVKFFMHNYSIPTKRDVEKLMIRLDRIESLIKAAAPLGPYQAKTRAAYHRTTSTAIDMVYEAIKRSKAGLSFAEIQAKTGFADKKIRNIIFRLNKSGKIKRKSRGIYITE